MLVPSLDQILAYVVVEVSQHSANPSRTYGNAIKSIFHYLKDITNKGITYGQKITRNKKPTILIGYTNAD